jgi:hypothetical protein
MYHEYTLGAKAGQMMTISFKADNRFAFFNVVPPSGDGALFVGSNMANPS